MERLGRNRVHHGRRWLVVLLLLPLLAGCFGSNRTSTGSDAAEPTADQGSAATTAGAPAPCARTQPEAIARILDLTPAGPPEATDGDPVVLIGGPRGLVAFTGCTVPLKGPQLDPDLKLNVGVYFAAGGHDDFEKIRNAATVKLTPVAALGDEAFMAMTLQTLVIARKGNQIVVVGYLVRNEENTIKVARAVVSSL